MDLFLFTNFFPYQKSEPFLESEFVFTKLKFKSITILSLYGDHNNSRLSRDNIVTLPEPLIKTPGNKRELLLRGLFNFAPCSFHLKDFFSNGIIFSPKKIYFFFISFLITRLALSSDSYKQLLKKVNSSEQALLYFYWGDNLAWLIPYLAKQITNPKTKIIMRLHGSDLFEDVKGNYAPLRRFIFENSDLILPVSQKGNDYLAEKYPEFKNKIKTSYLGVFDNGLNPIHNNDPMVIVSASNIVALKRVELIFECLQETKRAIVWHHFGSGPMLNELEEKIKIHRKGLEIKLHGYVQNAQLINFYKTNPVDLFINLSSSEGLPVSIMEAFSFGIPVIATNVGGTSELVNNTNGFLVDKDFKTETVAAYVQDFKSVTEKRQAARNTFEQKSNAETNYTAFYNLIIADDK